MFYVGVHKGHPGDGYVCSSKKLLERPRPDMTGKIAYIFKNMTPEQHLQRKHKISVTMKKIWEDRKNSNWRISK